VYGKLIASCLASNSTASNSTRLQGGLDALKKQVESDVRLLEKNYQWQPQKDYVFEFMVWAVACLMQMPVLCFEPKSSLDDNLYPYFKVYGDSCETGTMMDARAPFENLAENKLPALRDYDFSDGAGECANKGAILLDTNKYILLYFRDNHFQCISAGMDPGLATAVTNGGRRVAAPDMEQQRSLESSCDDDRAGVSASTAAASAPVMRAPARTAVRAPNSMTATEESRAVPKTSTGQSGRSSTYSDADRVSYVKSLAGQLVHGINLDDIDRRSRFGPSLSMLLCIHCEAVIVTTMPLQRHRPHCRLCQDM
jgi:hypothetical protein